MDKSVQKQPDTMSGGAKSRMKYHVSLIAASLLSAACALSVTGCTGQYTAGPTGRTPLQNAQALVSGPLQTYFHVLDTKYRPASQTVDIFARPIPHGPLTPTMLRQIAGQRTLDTAAMQGVYNFATATYADKKVSHVHLINRDMTRAPFGGVASRALSGVAGASVFSAMVPHFTSGRRISHTVFSDGMWVPPQGVTIDPSIRPRAGLKASYAQKLSGVLAVARSKLGTPYIWGHNEDRGQYGFDCSNYVEYVFHHALGYLFTDWSTRQYASVGLRVPLSQLRAGDIIFFDHGGHEGIYAGGGSMIQEGGGLGKVGYLPVSPGSYWGHHISVVKRMF